MDRTEAITDLLVISSFMEAVDHGLLFCSKLDNGKTHANLICKVSVGNAEINSRKDLARPQKQE